MDDSARAALRDYHWPGNIRELAHAIERAVLLARKPILSEGGLALPTTKPRPAPLAEDLAQCSPPPPAGTGWSSLDLRSALEALERRLIEQALQRAGGNRTEAAALLGLNRTTLVEKLRKLAA